MLELHIIIAMVAPAATAFVAGYLYRSYKIQSYQIWVGKMLRKVQEADGDEQINLVLQLGPPYMTIYTQGMYRGIEDTTAMLRRDREPTVALVASKGEKRNGRVQAL